MVAAALSPLLRELTQSVSDIRVGERREMQAKSLLSPHRASEVGW